jgi:DNA/RNA-binding domain of Phe-tRNA-synthetase-like protein/SAM-dependent methyltransferase
MKDLGANPRPHSLHQRDPFASDPWRPHGFVLLDVRSVSDFESGHVPGSCHLPAEELEHRKHELPPRWRPIFLTADTADLLRSCGERLHSLGRTRVRSVEEPPEAWPGVLETGPARIPAWEPPPVLQRLQSRFPPPTGEEKLALDLACGSGRHSVYLALLGWKVLAVDILDDALRMTRELAARWSVSVETQRMDLTREDPLTAGTFDLIATFHFLERRLLPRIGPALRPGGLLVYQTFTKSQSLKGRPRNPRHLLESGELHRAFPELDVLDYAEGTDPSGDDVALLVARRPTGRTASEARKDVSAMPSESAEPGSTISLTLDPAVQGRVTLGVLQMTGVDPNAPQDPIHDEFGRLGEEFRASYKEPSEASTLLRPARDLYKALGLDPTRNRPSSEALFRRLVKGSALYRVNAVVDAANLCSLKMFLPVGLYDAAKIRGPVLLRVGGPGDSYEGIGKGRINVEGRWTLADDEGPFGNPSADSWRTRIIPETRDILFVVFAPTGYDSGQLEDRVRECSDTLRGFCGGSVVGTGILS